MTTLGWVFLGCSLSFVWGLAIWCYYTILSEKEPPTEELHHFHSA